MHITDYDSIETFKSFLHESNTMKKFDHPNVLSIFGVCLENDHEAGVPFIVLPFMVNGDLKSYLKDHRTKPESVNQLPKVQLSGQVLANLFYVLYYVRMYMYRMIITSLILFINEHISSSLHSFSLYHS